MVGGRLPVVGGDLLEQVVPMLDFDHGLGQRGNRGRLGEIGLDLGEGFLGQWAGLAGSLKQATVVGAGAGGFQNAVGAGRIEQAGGDAGDGGSGGTAVLAVVAVNVDWAGQIVDGFGELV